MTVPQEDEVAGGSEAGVVLEQIAGVGGLAEVEVELEDVPVVPDESYGVSGGEVLTRRWWDAFGS